MKNSTWAKIYGGYKEPITLNLAMIHYCIRKVWKRYQINCIINYNKTINIYFGNQIQVIQSVHNLKETKVVIKRHNHFNFYLQPAAQHKLSDMIWNLQLQESKKHNYSTVFINSAYCWSIVLTNTWSICMVGSCFKGPQSNLVFIVTLIQNIYILLNC